MDNTKKYWFMLSPDIYVSRNGAEILLYNTKNGEQIETESIFCSRLIDEIYKPENNGVASVETEKLTDNDLQTINLIVDKNLGKTVEVKVGQPRPMVLLPILNLQKDVEKLLLQDDNSLGKDLLSNLSELIIYLNDKCEKKCNGCRVNYKQTLSCTKDDGKNTLLPETVEKILSQIKYSAVKNIQILGGDLNLYPYWSELRTIISEYDFVFHYWLNYQNLPDFKIAGKKEITINFPVEKEALKRCFASINDDRTFHFQIENAADYEKAEKIIADYGVKQYRIVPIYNGKNIDFFKENVFIDREDIFSKPIEHRKIFCNQKLNSNYFGKLLIMANGDAKASINTQTLGNIQTDSIVKIIYNEMLNNTSWRKVRESEPCSDCLYQYLCPPPSNYETVIGKLNLCNIE